MKHRTAISGATSVALAMMSLATALCCRQGSATFGSRSLSGRHAQRGSLRNYPTGGRR